MLVTTPLPLAAGLTPDPREATWNRSGHLWGYAPAIKSINAFVNAELPLDDTWNLYGFATLGRNRKTAGTNHTTAASDSNVRALFPEGIDAFTIVTSTQAVIAGGMKGNSDQWGSVDISLYNGRFVKDTVSAPTVNPTFGLKSKTDLDVGGGDNRLTSLTADWTRDVAVNFLTAPLTLSAGIGVRRESFTNVAGEYQSWADGGVLILDGPDIGRFAPAARWHPSRRGNHRVPQRGEPVCTGRGRG